MTDRIKAAWQASRQQQDLIRECAVEITDLGLILRAVIAHKDDGGEIWSSTRGMLMRIEELTGAISMALDDQPIEPLQSTVYCLTPEIDMPFGRAARD